MKKLALIAIFAGLLANAAESMAFVSAVVGSKQEGLVFVRFYAPCVGILDVPGIFPCATTSFPTLLIDGQEVDLGSQEANARLGLEAQGLVDKQIITVIAADTNLPVEVITAHILQMKSQGIEVSVESVLTSLAKQ